MAALPKNGWSRKDTTGTVPEATETAENNEYCVEHHVYGLRSGLALDLVRRLLHKVIPGFIKYPYFIYVQMRKREIKEKQKNGEDTEKNSQEFLDDGSGFNDISDKHKESSDQKDRRKYADSKVIDVISRFLVAFVGGGALLAPMLIMTYHTSQSARLITVCVAVLVFGFLFAIGTRATNQEVLAASAAYAAVMVVYIGSASTGNGSAVNGGSGG